MSELLLTQPQAFPSKPHQLVPQESFFYAKRVNGVFRIAGQPQGFLGHRISLGAGKDDQGTYAEWTWDGQRLVIHNDRMGFYPLFYYHTADEMCVSPSLIKILQMVRSRELDYVALSVFLRLGFFIGNDTPFQYIKALDPDCCLQWEDGALTKQGGEYWTEEPVAIERNAAIDGYISLFRQAMKRRLPQDEHFTAPLSGGRDSRHILFELEALGYRPQYCVTHAQYPHRTGEDVRIAKLLTAAMKIDHVVVEQKGSRLQSELQKNFLTSMCSDEHAQSLVLGDYLRGKVNTYYDGLGGDILSENPFFYQLPHKLEDRHYPELAQMLFSKFAKNLEDRLQKVLHPEIYHRLSLECATEHLMAELKKHRQARNAVDFFYFWNRRRREINLIPYSILDHIPVTHSPYLDHDLYCFLSRLPAEIVQDKTFHTETIQKAYPQYAHIPFTNPDAQRIGVREHNETYFSAIARYYLKNLRLKSHFLNHQVLLGPLMTCAIHKSHCSKVPWVPFQRVIYLLQLETLLKR